MIMNSGIGDDSLGNCQNSGSPFDEGIYFPQSPLHTNGAGDHCMIRNVQYESFANTGGIGSCWFASPEELMDLIGSTNDYNLFDNTLESGSGMHGSVHVCISGNMVTFWSPDDPAFFLHHTFIG